MASDRHQTMMKTVADRLGRFFARLADAQTRTTQVQALQNLDDAALAKMGLRRQDIVRDVYRDVYYV